MQVLYIRDSNGKVDVRDSTREPVNLIPSAADLGATLACKLMGYVSLFTPYTLGFIIELNKGPYSRIGLITLLLSSIQRLCIKW